MANEEVVKQLVHELDLPIKAVLHFNRLTGRHAISSEIIVSPAIGQLTLTVVRIAVHFENSENILVSFAIHYLEVSQNAPEKLRDLIAARFDAALEMYNG